MHAVIRGVGDVEIAVRIERDGPWVIHLAGFGASAAEHFNTATSGIENLDTAVTEFADETISFSIDAHIVWVAHFAWSGTGTTEGGKEFAVGGENLDAVIAGVSDVEAIVGTDAEALGAIQFAIGGAGGSEGLNEIGAVMRETLDAFNEAVFADVDVTVGIDGDGARELKPGNVGAVLTPLREELAVMIEMIHAGIMGLDDDDVAIAVLDHAFGFANVGLGHLPRKEVLAGGRKFLDATGEINDVEVVIAIEGDGSRLIELTCACAARTDDFDRGEKLAADSHCMLRRLSATGDEKEGGGGCRGNDETLEICSD